MSKRRKKKKNPHCGWCLSRLHPGKMGWMRVLRKNCLNKNGYWKPCRHFEPNMDHPRWKRDGFKDVSDCCEGNYE